MDINFFCWIFLCQVVVFVGLSIVLLFWFGFVNVQFGYQIICLDFLGDFGDGRMVVILGVGVVGFIIVYVLVNVGFKIQIFEVDNCYGGCSLMVWLLDEIYKDWWFFRYNL